MRLKKAKDFASIACGALILALGINIFLLPSNISAGGVSGMGILLFHTLKIPIWATTLAVNAVLFFFGYRTLGRTALAKSAAGILCLSAFLALTEKISMPVSDIFIASVFGGVLCGAGIGLTVRIGASTGGSDFAAIMINKAFPYISAAKLIMIIDCSVVAVSGAVFADYEITLYSLVSLYISVKTVDFVITSGKFAKCLYIISDSHEEIANRIMSELGRGVTGIDSVGLYTGKKGKMLMCAAGAKEVFKAVSIIKSVDKNAFTVISDVREIYGEGFSET